MKTLVILTLILLFESQAKAFVVSPTTLDLELTGKKSTATVQVTNRGEKSIALAVYMKTRDFDEFATESREVFDVKKNFLVLPANLTIKPHSSVSVRIVYIGPKDLKIEKAYRVIFANLSPETLIKPGTGATQVKVQALVSYAAALYVGPKKTKADLKANGVVKKNNKNYFVIENKGTKHAKINDALITISASNLKDKEVFPAKEFKTLDAPILPGETRYAEMPEKSKANPENASIEIGEWQ